MLDRIIPGLTVLLRQAGMRCHTAYPLLAPLRAIAHLRQVFVQNASLSIDLYGDQWLRTIPPAANRLLQSAVSKQLRQETWDKHVAAEAVLSDRNLLFTDPTVSAAAPRCCSQTCIALNLCPSISQALSFFKTLGRKEATPFAPVVMLPQVPLSSVQPPASAKPIPWVPLASQASHGVTLPPQSLSEMSASSERDSFLFGKTRVQSIAFQLERLCTGKTVLPLVSCRSGRSQIFKQSQKHLRRSPRSQRCLQTSAGGMAARRKQGSAAWPSQDLRMALLLRLGTAWMPWEAPW